MTRWPAVLTATAALIAAPAAQAQAVFAGDCARAAEMQKSTPMKERISGRYKGFTLLAPQDSCGRETVRLWELTPKSASPNEVVYDFTAATYKIRKRSGTCQDHELWNDDVYGRVTFVSRVERRSGYCELVVEARFVQMQRSSPGKSIPFTLKVVFIDANHFSLNLATDKEGSVFFRY